MVSFLFCITLHFFIFQQQKTQQVQSLDDNSDKSLDDNYEGDYYDDFLGEEYYEMPAVPRFPSGLTKRQQEDILRNLLKQGYVQSYQTQQEDSKGLPRLPLIMI